MSAKGRPHPQDEASFISRVTLWWIFGTLKVGFARRLEHDDLFRVRDDDRAERATKRLQMLWEEEKIMAKLEKRRPSLWKAALRFLTPLEYAFLVVCCLLRIGGQNLAVYCIVNLIADLGTGAVDTKTFSPWRSLVVSYGIVLGLSVREFALHNFHLNSSIPAIRVRAAILGLIYNKVLSLPQAVVDPGHVMELISDDSQRLVICAEWLAHDSVSVIIESLTMFGWLAHYFGWQGVVASMFFVAVGFLRILFISVDFNLRKDAFSLADKRLGYLREILAGIRSVKLNTWEEILEEKVKNIKRVLLLYISLDWLNTVVQSNSRTVK